MCLFVLYKSGEGNITISLRALDFGVYKAIRFVRFDYNTFTGCVA